MTIEEHGAGKQLVRFRTWPRFSLVGLGIASVFAALAGIAGFEHDWQAAILLSGFASVPAVWSLLSSARAKVAFEGVLLDLGAQVLREVASAFAPRRAH